MKSPPVQMRDSVARDLTEAFIEGSHGEQFERTGQAIAGE
jgi:hypothetical protein